MQSEDSHEPEIVREFPLAGGHARGFVVVDSLLGGGGTGGVRAGDDITLDEVAALAREMTFKFAWLNIPRGGAKSGICFGTPTRERTGSIFQSFGAEISDLLVSGQYVAGQDMGVGDSEFQEIMRGAGIGLKDTFNGSGIDSNYYTALTVFMSIRTAAEFQGKSLSGTTVLIEGVGKVGRHLLRLLDEAGAIVRGASTIRGALFDEQGIDVSKLVKLSEEHGDDCIERYGSGSIVPASDLYRQCADILVPGARVNAIDDSMAKSLAVNTVVSIANAAATQSGEATMHSRGILFLPGFVCNSGGIFCWYMASQTANTRYALLDREFANKVRGLLRQAMREKISVSDLARRQALRNAERMRNSENSAILPGLVGRLSKFSPWRLPYVVLRKVMGRKWAGQDTVFVHWYFESRYLS